MSEEIASLVLRISSLEADVAEERLDNLGRTSRETEKATDGLTSAFKGLAAAGASLLVLAPVISQHRQFTKSISELSAITGAAGEDLEFFREQALLLGSSTTFSSQEVATAFKLMASKKPELLESRDAMAAVTKEVLSLAEAAGLTLPDAATALGGSLNQFSAGADQASRFINVLAAGAKFGSSEINQTSEAMKNAGSTAATLGLTFEETNASIQVLAKGEILAAEAGTALRGILLKLAKQSNDEFNPSIVGISTAMVNLQKAALEPTEMMKIFGEESFNAASSMIENADSIEEMTAKLTGTQTAYDQAATNTDNLDGDIKALSSSWSGLALIMGDKLDPSLRSTAQLLTEVGAEAGLLVSSGFIESWADTVASKFDGIVEDARTASNLISMMFETEFSAVGFSAKETASFISDSFEQMPENIRAFVKIMTVELAAFLDKTVAYGEAIRDGLFFWDDQTEVLSNLAKEQDKLNTASDRMLELKGDFGFFAAQERRSLTAEISLRNRNISALNEELSGVNALAGAIATADEARISSIETILKERDESIASYEDQITKAKELIALSRLQIEIAETGPFLPSGGRPDEEQMGPFLPEGGRPETPISAVDASGIRDFEIERQRIRAEAFVAMQEDLRASNLSEMQIVQEDYELRKQIATTHLDETFASEQRKNETLEAMKSDHLSRIKSMEMASNAEGLSMASGMFTSLGNLQDKGSKKGFERAQKFARAATIANTAAAIMNEAAQGDWISKPGRMIAMGLAGAAQLATINRTSFGGGGSAGGGAQVSGGGAGGFGSAPQPQPQQQAAAATNTTTVMIIGNVGDDVIGTVVDRINNDDAVMIGDDSLQMHNIATAVARINQ